MINIKKWSQFQAPQKSEQKEMFTNIYDNSLSQISNKFKKEYDIWMSAKRKRNSNKNLVLGIMTIKCDK